MVSAIKALRFLLVRTYACSRTEALKNIRKANGLFMSVVAHLNFDIGASI